MFGSASANNNFKTSPEFTQFSVSARKISARETVTRGLYTQRDARASGRAGTTEQHKATSLADKILSYKKLCYILDFWN